MPILGGDDFTDANGIDGLAAVPVARLLFNLAVALCPATDIAGQAPIDFAPPAT